MITLSSELETHMKAIKKQTPRSEVIKWTIFISILTALAFATGCSGVKSQSQGYTRIVTPDGIVYEHDASGKTVTTDPSNSSHGGNAWTNPYGAGGQTSGVNQPTGEQILAEKSTIFFAIAGACGIGAIVAAFVFKQLPLAFGLGAGAAGFALLPNIIATAGPILGIALPVGAIGAGVIWWMAKRSTQEKERIATVDKAIDLANQGKVNESLAVVSTAPTWRAVAQRKAVASASIRS